MVVKTRKYLKSKKNKTQKKNKTLRKNKIMKGGSMGEYATANANAILDPNSQLYKIFHLFSRANQQTSIGNQIFPRIVKDKEKAGKELNKILINPNNTIYNYINELISSNPIKPEHRDKIVNFLRSHYNMDTRQELSMPHFEILLNESLNQVNRGIFHGDY